MLSTIFTGIIAFITTNLDDIFILMTLFSQTSGEFRQRHIILGQYLGILFLTVISILGAWGLLFLPKEWIGFLGLVPIYMGLRQLYDLIKERVVKIENPVKNVEEDIGDKEEDSIVLKKEVVKNKFLLALANLININTLKVASITFANGGDNIGIYIPLFASLNLSQLIIIYLVFFLLTGLWCYIGSTIIKYPFISKGLDNYGHIIIPVVLIGLGAYIFYVNNSVSLFYRI